jgi:hypothetical protein
MWTDRHAVLAFGIHVTTMTVRSRVGGDVDHNSAGLGQRLFPWIGRSRDCAFFPSRALCISASCVDALTDIAKAKKISEAMKASIPSLHSGLAGTSVFISAEVDRS